MEKGIVVTPQSANGNFLNSKVLVDGASGYLGNHVVAALLKRGLVVHALVRPQVAARDRQFLEESGAQVFAADLAPFQSNLSTSHRRTLEEAFTGVSHAVHLIGSIAPAKSENFSQLHQEQSRAFASWCVRARDVAGFSGVAMVTALGADQGAAGAPVAGGDDDQPHEHAEQHAGQRPLAQHLLDEGLRRSLAGGGHGPDRATRGRHLSGRSVECRSGRG